MDGVTLQGKVYSGYSKAALRVGLTFNIFRPIAALNALSNQIGSTPAAFTPHTASNFNFGRGSDYKQPLFHALLDGTQIAIGDYLVHPTRTDIGPYFIVRKEPLLPPLAVECNRVIKISTPGPSTLSGTDADYLGTVGTPVASNEITVMSGWPASVLQGSRSTSEHMALPADVGKGVFDVLMPFFSGVYLSPSDEINDNIGNRYTIRSGELTNLGWRISCVQAVA